MTTTQENNSTKGKCTGIPIVILILILIFVLVLFLAWPSIATYWASCVNMSEKHGATEEQFKVMENVHSSLGVLFSGFAFCGTFAVFYFTRKQVELAEKQVEIERCKLNDEKSRDRAATYRQVIENVHSFYFKIENPYKKGDMLVNFSELIYCLWAIPRQDEVIKKLEKYFFEAKKAWHSTCCLYANTLTRISYDNNLKRTDKDELLKYLRAPFSPMDELAMAIFYQGALHKDMPKYWREKGVIMKGSIWDELGSFENWAKSRVNSLCRATNSINPGPIYSEIIKVLRTQNIYPTEDGNVSLW